MKQSLLLLMCMVLSLATWGQDSTDGITVSDDGATVTVDLTKARLSSVTNTDKVTSLTLTSDNANTGVTFEDAKYLHDNFANLVTLDMGKTIFLADATKPSEPFQVTVVDAINSSKVESSTTYKGSLSYDIIGRIVPAGLCAGKTKLVKVILPNVGGRNSSKIGDYAFAGCTSLESIDLGGNGNFTSLGNGVFVGCVKLKKIDMSGFKNNGTWTIGNKAFQYCTSLESVIFPSESGRGPKSIGTESFKTCNSLVSIVLPTSLQTIGSNAFNGCNALASIVLPNSVTSIGNSCFSVCPNLASVTLSENTDFTTISNSAFSRCDKLTTITLPKNITTIEASAFAASGLTSITVTSAEPPTCNYSNFSQNQPFASVRPNKFVVNFTEDAVGQEAKYRNAAGWKYILTKYFNEEDANIGRQSYWYYDNKNKAWKKGEWEWSNPYVSAGKGLNATLIRTFTDGWNSLVVPFSASGDVVKKALGENVKVAKLTGFDGSKLTFTTIDDCSIPENTPVIVSGITLCEGQKQGIYKGELLDTLKNVYFFDGVDISKQYKDKPSVDNPITVNGITMTGTLYQNTRLSLKNGYFLQNGKLYAADANTIYKANGFRAWFVTDGSNAKPLTFSVDGGEATSISKIDAGKADNGKIYDLQGREVSKPVKGIYIKNGRKFIVK